MKKIAGIIIVGILFITLIVQGSVAYFHEETNFTNRISAGTLGIELVEASEDKQAVLGAHGYQFSNTLPGARLDRRVWVENTREKDVYVRVRATRAWYDANGEKQSNLDASLISLKTENPNNWIIQEDTGSNQEIITFYYKKPIAKGDRTENVMDAFEISDQISNGIYQNVHAQIIFEAEAIQASAGTEAMLNEWGMDVQIDQDGTIVEVLE